ncbi:leucyl aminopeptidase family protein [Jannaschia sp. Os4]|uniref:leucyl aminopeptidase family protein n=1 Tax=Jannaschia sp. Os4 TaxID=2807617 RepID=UPI00193A9BE4|nr:leucyl aminopeptidase family protein [Jannaschia sp. Os4]MBM2575415.1 leucyl aminopeptidase family protein [Jannaschia sp. Os4]
MRFAPSDASAIPLTLVPSDGVDAALDALAPEAAAWARASRFKGRAGEVLRLPGDGGGVGRVLVGWGTERDHARERFLLARAATALGEGTYRLDTPLDGAAADEAALAWLLAGYRFGRYKDGSATQAWLVAPEGVDAPRLEAVAAGETLTRDLVNTPAADMGPEELECAMRDLAEAFGGTMEAVTGDALLDANLPMIHAVGRASARAPRLLDARWGDGGPRVTLVGKGVVFDTGGLNLKPGGSMGLMKKDMGGAATVLGLAHMILATGMDVRLRVLIPAVENAVAGNAFRPGDVLTSRAGKTVEINNTDAEGRLVLADALTVAGEEETDLIVCMATLTGAARVAVGPDLAPFYTDDDALAAALAASAAKVRDPVWRMPLHRPYDRMIEPAIADLDNAPSGGMAGSVTAALFLDRFAADRAAGAFVHFDIYGWNPAAAPARPKGGVGMGARAVFDALPGIAG